MASFPSSFWELGVEGSFHPPWRMAGAEVTERPRPGCASQGTGVGGCMGVLLLWFAPQIPLPGPSRINLRHRLRWVREVSWKASRPKGLLPSSSPAGIRAGRAKRSQRHPLHLAWLCCQRASKAGCSWHPSVPQFPPQPSVRPSTPWLTPPSWELPPLPDMLLTHPSPWCKSQGRIRPPPRRWAARGQPGPSLRQLGPANKPQSCKEKGNQPCCWPSCFLPPALPQLQVFVVDAAGAEPQNSSAGSCWVGLMDGCWGRGC